MRCMSATREKQSTITTATALRAGPPEVPRTSLGHKWNKFSDRSTQSICEVHLSHQPRYAEGVLDDLLHSRRNRCRIRQGLVDGSRF
jgi:hypothetical protein